MGAHNLVRVLCSSTGTGRTSLAIGAAIDGLTPASAGVVDGEPGIGYSIFDYGTGKREVGTCSYSSTGPVINGITVENSSDGVGVALSLSGSSILEFVFTAGQATMLPTQVPDTNLVINGACEVSEEVAGGTNWSLVSGTGWYIIDMWFAKFVGGTMVLQAKQATNSGEFPFVFQLKATTGASSFAAGDYTWVYSPIEGYRSAYLQWGTASAKAINIGFWFNSPINGNLTLAICNGAWNRTYLKDVAVVIGWQWVTMTIPGDTTGTWYGDYNAGIIIQFCFGAGTTVRGTNNAWNAGWYLSTATTSNFFATTNNTVQITGLIVTDKPLPPSSDTRRYFRPYNQELPFCQRYLFSHPGMCLFEGNSGNSSAARGYGKFGVQMRAIPTITINSGDAFSGSNGQVFIPNTNSAQAATPSGIRVSGFSGLTATSFDATYQYMCSFTADARM